MKAAELIYAALETKGVKQKQLAKMIGKTAQNLNRKLVNNRFLAQEFIDSLEKLGFKVVVKTLDGNNLQIRNTGLCPRTRKMVGGVIYDTEKSDAICHSPVVDGWRNELYQDMQGRYFIVHYDDKFANIIPCSEDRARGFYETHG